MPISQVSSFMTSDGKKFSTLEEAEAHEMSLEIDGDMQRIADKHEIPTRTLSTLKRWLPVIISEMGYRRIESNNVDADAYVESDDTQDAVQAA